MKPMTNSTMRVRIKGLDSERVRRIDFLFRISSDRHSKKIIQKTYEPEGKILYDSEKDCYNIPFTSEETDKFPGNSVVWLDIRPLLYGGTALPVRMLRFTVTPTLFTRGDVSDS